MTDRAHFSSKSGGADHGMDPHLGYGTVHAVFVLRMRAPPPVGGGISSRFAHHASPAAGLYAKWGLLPKGYGDSGREEAGVARSIYAIVVHELHFNRHDYLIWASYGTVQPVFVLRTGGVPVVSVYRRP